MNVSKRLKKFEIKVDKGEKIGYNLKALNMKRADIAQSVECILGKDEVTGSNPVISSKQKSVHYCGRIFVCIIHFSLLIGVRTDF